MEYLTIVGTLRKWKLSQKERVVCVNKIEERMPCKKEKWLIPYDSEKPEEARKNNYCR